MRAKHFDCMLLFMNISKCQQDHRFPRIFNVTNIIRVKKMGFTFLAHPSLA